MSLPFNHREFLDVFGTYNGAAWPFAAVLWLATLLAIIFWNRSTRHRGRVVFGLLAIQWAWSALVYFLAFFWTINPAAPLFATLFLLPALLFAWFATRGSPELRSGRTAGSLFGMALMIYSVLYPFVGMAFGMRYPRLPTFGVPCPTAILTAGVLLLTVPRAPGQLMVVPLLWSAIAGSAAVLLGITGDIVLIVSGFVLLVRLVSPVRRLRRRTAHDWQEIVHN